MSTLWACLKNKRLVAAGLPITYINLVNPFESRLLLFAAGAAAAGAGAAPAAAAAAAAAAAIFLSVC